MWKSAILVAMAALLGTPAEAARFDFEGFFRIRDKSGTCNDYNPVGTRGIARLRYEIPTVPNNSDHNITLFDGSFTQGFRRENGYFDNTFRAADGSVSVSGGFGQGHDGAGVFIRVASQNAQPTPTPGVGSTIGANTEFINAVYQIRNYDFMVGCIVTVHLSLQKRPQ